MQAHAHAHAQPRTAPGGGLAQAARALRHDEEGGRKPGAAASRGSREEETVERKVTDSGDDAEAARQIRDAGALGEMTTSKAHQIAARAAKNSTSKGPPATTARQACLSAHAVASSALGDELKQLHKIVVSRGGGIWALSEVPGVREDAVKRWERAHGLALAADLLDLLRATDGILVRWAVPLFGRVKDIGCLHVNSLHFIVPVEPRELRASPIAGRTAFAIGRQKRVGLTALVYPRRYNSRQEGHPEVWFCDLSGAWHFLAARFADYFRLVLVHLGIRGWEYAFTPGGLDPDTKQWLRLLAPDRLALDEAHASFDPAYAGEETDPASEPAPSYALHLIDELGDEDDFGLVSSSSRSKVGAPSGAGKARGTTVTKKKKKKLATSTSRKGLDVKRKTKAKTALAAGASLSH